MRHAAALLALLAFAGCNSGDENGGGSGREGGSVTIGLATAPDSMDPALASSPEATQAVWLVHTPLLTYARRSGAAGTRIVPGLAEKVPKPSDSGLTWELKLREGLLYSNGRQVRAADFERGLRRARALNPRVRQQLRQVDVISADERTRMIRIILKRPDPLLPYKLVNTWAAPVPRGTPTREVASVPGVGPYTVGRRERGSAYVLTRRRGFEQPGVPGGNVDVISARVVPNPESRTARTIAGTIDAMEGEPPATRLAEVRSKYKARYSEHSTLALRFAQFDVASRRFRDENVRRAVSFALDERTLTRLEGGFLAPACTAIPQVVPGYEAPDPCPYGEREGNSDLVEARELVEEAPDVSARVLVDGGDGPRAAVLARYGVETLDKIGLRARRARTPRERRRAHVRFATRLPAIPHPARYLELVDDDLFASRVSLLELAGSPVEHTGDWAELDREIVSDALLAPYGVSRTGVLLSERLDAENCLRFHPVHGLDLSSLCVR